MQIVLCQMNGRWETAAVERPFGRGVNFQMQIERLGPVLERLQEARWPIYEAPRDAWCRTGDVEGGQRECLVQHPDGYLVRPAESLGTRPPPRG